jgi:hypothetical protein
LATDLGRGGTWNSGTEACQAAIAAVGDARNELTASARIAVNLQPPRCTASMDAMADCAADCDANLEPGQVEVQCEPGKLAGRCDAQCQGTCELQAAARCEGTCQGSCTAEFSGQCGGDCTGTCDGKDVRGASCAGKCEGACSGGAEGRCGGQCKGDCKLSGAAQCQGTCHGSCTAEMKAPRCEGEMTPPKASAECRAQCDARVQGQVECQPAHVAVVVEGAANPQLAAKYAAAIENNLPAVLRIAVGMKDQALGVAGNVKTVVEGVQVAVSQVSAPDVGARLAACVAAPFKSAFDAAASVQANVSVSVDVQASASASASGRAGGSAG